MLKSPRTGKGVPLRTITLDQREAADIASALWMARNALPTETPAYDAVDSALIMLGAKGAPVPTEPKDEGAAT